jgi:hypothetical protein
MYASKVFAPLYLSIAPRQTQSSPPIAKAASPAGVDLRMADSRMRRSTDSIQPG